MHNPKQTYQLHLHGLSVYYGHHELLAEELLRLVHVPDPLLVNFAPAGTENSYWRSVLTAAGAGLKRLKAQGAPLPQHIGASTAAVILSTVGAAVVPDLWLPDYRGDVAKQQILKQSEE